MAKRSKKKTGALQYVEDVSKGNILACKWVRLAVERHVRDLKRQEKKSFPYYFDPDTAKHTVDFFGFLRHTKGEWAGQVFKLEPWEEFITCVVFGWLRKKDGLRRFRTVFLEVGRKNGKSTFLAGVGLYLFDGDNEPGSEVYTAATKRDQARISHSEATRMVKVSHDLKDHIGIFKDNLHCERTGSKFEPLGRDSDTMDGLNIHGALVDEIHAHKTRDTWDVLDTATGARRQPLMWGITTAGFNRQTICWELHEYTQKILDAGPTKDETFFGIIYCLDEGDDWEDEKNWIKANPNLKVSVKLDDLQRKAVKAKATPAALNVFLRKHMNEWTQAETRWIDPSKWRECSGKVDPEALTGRTCYGGLDLSSNSDLTAFVLVFPPEEEDGLYQALGRFWIPEENMHERSRKDRVPYESWWRRKLIEATPGNVIDYRWILAQIDKDAQQYDLKEIAFDRWGATKVIQDLQEMGFEDESEKYAPRHLIQFGQGYKSMSPPMKELETLILSKRLAHGGNEVFAWAADNVVASQDPAGNLKPNKEKSTEKIDPIVALIMGLDRAFRHEEATSKYESEGLTVI